MTDKELLYIKTIAEEKNITHAAQKLHIAQPSLTQCIKRIEKSIGRPLFYRQKTGLVLTDAGELYVKTACHILDIWERFSKELEEMDSLKGGTLSIGASWYNTLLVLTKILPEYNQKYPYVNVSLTEKNTGELERLLFQGELDLMLSHEYPEEFHAKQNFDSKRLVCHPLFREPFCLVVPREFGIKPELIPTESGNSRENGMPLVDLKKLEKIPFVRFRENQRIRHISDFILAQAQITPLTALFTYGFPSALELARQGVGAVFLPQFYVQDLTRDPKLCLYGVPERYSAYWTSCVCYYQSDYMPVTVESFLTALEKTKKDDFSAM